MKLFLESSSKMVFTRKARKITGRETWNIDEKTLLTSEKIKDGAFLREDETNQIDKRREERAKNREEKVVHQSLLNT